MKLFTFCFAFLLFCNSGNAQCTPDTTLIGSDFYFAPANSQYVTINGTDYAILPYAQNGQSYDEVLQFKIPVDTTVNTLTATIDHLKVLSIQNLPPSLQLNCNPSNCTFPGGSFGCVQITGLGGQPDSILLKVVVELKFSNGGSSFTAVDTIKDIVLVTQGMVGLEERVEESLINTFPNPVNDILNISLAKGSTPVIVKIISLNGSLVLRKEFSANSNDASFVLDVSSLKEGVYLVSLENGKESLHSKITVIH